MTNKNDFEFKYSAPTNAERREIESIRNNYLKQENQPDKLIYLRKLDSKVKSIPTMISLIIGTVGFLIFGLGIAMILEWGLLAWGIVVSVVGVPFMLCAYPVNNFVLKRMKDKYSEEILKISEELLNDENK